jgi:hypothetical protein
LKEACERVLKSEMIGDEKEKKEKDTIIVAYSLIITDNSVESSLFKRIPGCLIKIISKCVLDSSLLNVGMKAAIALDGLRCCLFL